MGMYVLDLDLDFFIQGRVTGRSDARSNRPSDAEVQPQPHSEVSCFLEGACGLSKERRVPGQIVESHHELFPVLKHLIQTGRLTVPFELVHIDAHFDFGVGWRAASWKYILTELLLLPPEARANVRVGGSDGLNFTNHLSFCLACRWLHSIQFVLHEEWYDDLPKFYMEEFGPDSFAPPIRSRANHDFNLRMRRIDASAIEGISNPSTIAAAMIDCGEPVVPTRLITKETFQFHGTFDYMFLSRSPGYTPPEADALVPVFESYMREL